MVVVFTSKEMSYLMVVIFDDLVGSLCYKSSNNEDLRTSAREELQRFRSFFKHNDQIKLLYFEN